MTEQSDVASEGAPTASSAPSVGTFAGIDTYVWRARIAPAIVATFPVLSLGALLLPLLVDAEKLWSLASLGITTLAALIARRAGNRVQPSLLNSWGGWPTTDRLRHRSQTSPQEVARRHDQVRRVLGSDVRLPTEDEEAADPAGADVIYVDVTRRVTAMVRGDAQFRLVNVENRNYGYARNLLGLKRFGRACALATLLVAAAATAIAAETGEVRDALGLIFPAVSAVVALALWPQVDSDFVRPSADAYADRLIEALDRLPSAPPA